MQSVKLNCLLKTQVDQWMFRSLRHCCNKLQPVTGGWFHIWAAASCLVLVITIIPVMFLSKQAGETEWARCFSPMKMDLELFIAGPRSPETVMSGTSLNRRDLINCICAACFLSHCCQTVTAPLHINQRWLCQGFYLLILITQDCKCWHIGRQRTCKFWTQHCHH